MDTVERCISNNNDDDNSNNKNNNNIKLQRYI